MLNVDKSTIVIILVRFNDLIVIIANWKKFSSYSLLIIIVTFNDNRLSQISIV